MIADLCRTYRLDHDEIEIVIRVNWTSLPIDQAVPCGLLLNELVSNSFKHAFGAKVERPRLEIELSTRQQGVRRLFLRDNGCGVPAGFDASQAETFGMQLILTLIEQLKGEMSLGVGPGFEFAVTFPT